MKFILSGGKKVATGMEKIPLVIFSDHKRYWNVFEPICRELNERGVDVVYYTASPDDPALSASFEHMKSEFIGEGNKAFARLNFLNAKVVFSTTPGLDVYQWKRSKDVDYYVHILHGANEVAGYRMFGIDHYDAILLSGDYQIRDTRNLEKLRELPEKELVLVGVPYMDEMDKRLRSRKDQEEVSSSKDQEKVPTVLLGPTWGPSSILSRYGGAFIKDLLATGYHIIVRPHPQSFTSEKELMDQLMKEYPESDQLEWNRDNDNFDVLCRSDILISDYSGVVFDFTLVHDKPLIYTESELELDPYDAWWLDTPFWTSTAIPRLGEPLTEENRGSLKELIDRCLHNPEYAARREEVCNETWVHRGEGATRVADYLCKKLEELA